MIRSETLEKVWSETRRRAEALRAAAKALGLPLYSKSPSDSVTAIDVPAGVDGEALRDARSELSTDRPGPLLVQVGKRRFVRIRFSG